MWELIVPLIVYGEREHPQQWHAPIVAEQTATLGPYATRSECHQWRRWLIERTRYTWYAGEAGNEPVGFNRRWVFTNREQVGYCQTVVPHSSN